MLTLMCRYDDLIEEENDVVQEALKRLPADEMYKRSYRIRIAQQCGVTHTELPPEQWTKPEDVCFLVPLRAVFWVMLMLGYSILVSDCRSGSR